VEVLDDADRLVEFPAARLRPLRDVRRSADRQLSKGRDRYYAYLALAKTL
jgi:hypothetical protein